MKTNMTLVAVGFVILSCSNGKDSGSGDEISGVYSREYSFTVVNPETGSDVGIRTIRDTIFIRPAENGYELSNAKWKLNDYDAGGWQNMEHSDSRPMQTFTASFNDGNSSLTSESGQALFLDLENKKLFIDNKHENSYEKIK